MRKVLHVVARQNIPNSVHPLMDPSEEFDLTVSELLTPGEEWAVARKKAKELYGKDWRVSSVIPN